MATKVALLILLGLLWAVRIAAIKAAGLSGVPVHVVVTIAALGLAAVFTALAVARSDWPPVDRGLLGFYLLSGTFGFLAPFALEGVVAPHLPVFVFVVVIATMPILTLVLSILTGGERLAPRPVISVALGFAGAMAILWDTAREGGASTVSHWWIAAAFGVPALYALNTVFVARRWPAEVGAVQVAHAQALIVGTAALLGSLATGTGGDLRLASLDLPALGLIVAGEALALLVYLRITRDYGATWVSFANYVSMVFAAGIGAVVFGDRITVLTVVAALAIVVSVTIYQRRNTA
ncbi:DMT family transporter [Jannaschia rubra]|uniref:Carboxylate/amino acid/amine transporter n=1 Tax=Jannaschia rubra TaxID=282197 RepID=A0A0M6XW86_9RHOB|nr:DMT family transporter [Jannaschia rubra]CTQ34837.1 carboxylate/amino acid/amine transporter [Jannaschia rubra]SFG66525.1 EamA-like transporter family protein [Jannaschia rubra]